MQNRIATTYGPWALVTGASSGIGQEFARELAEKQMNVVIVARREERLNQLAQELEGQHGVQIRVVPADLTKCADRQKVFEQTSDLSIGLLINNAGIAHPGPFLEKSHEQLQQVVDLNITAVMQFTRHYAVPMAKQKRGGIIFTSSVMAYYSSTYYAVYAASKAFEMYLSQGLYYELKEHGIDTLVLTPGLTDTEMLDIMQSQGADMRSAFGKFFPPMSSRRLTQKALRALGHRITLLPGLSYKFSLFMSQCLLPARLTLYLSTWFIRRTLIN